MDKNRRRFRSRLVRSGLAGITLLAMRVAWAGLLGGAMALLYMASQGWGYYSVSFVPFYISQCFFVHLFNDVSDEYFLLFLWVCFSLDVFLLMLGMQLDGVYSMSFALLSLPLSIGLVLGCCFTIAFLDSYRSRQPPFRTSLNSHKSTKRTK